MDSWNGSLPWFFLLSAVLFVGSIAVAGVLIVNLPNDYLSRDRPPEHRLLLRWPLLRAVWWFGKNTTGLLCVTAGIIMLVTPGQGVLFIFLGLTLLDFPGKRRFVRRLLGRPGMFETINKIRARAQRSPLEHPGTESPSD